MVFGPVELVPWNWYRGISTVELVPRNRISGIGLELKMSILLVSPR